LRRKILVVMGKGIYFFGGRVSFGGVPLVLLVFVVLVRGSPEGGEGEGRDECYLGYYDVD